MNKIKKSTSVLVKILVKWFFIYLIATDRYNISIMVTDKTTAAINALMDGTWSTEIFNYNLHSDIALQRKNDMSCLDGRTLTFTPFDRERCLKSILVDTDPHNYFASLASDTTKQRYCEAWAETKQILSNQYN